MKINTYAEKGFPSRAIIKENRKEHRILKAFIDLGKDKSALLLSIAETHTELTARIYSELTERFPCSKGNYPSRTHTH